MFLNFLPYITIFYIDDHINFFLVIKYFKTKRTLNFQIISYLMSTLLGY